ncbi:MAG: GvpL/GvpF family gas vesicle protein [Nitrososphaera sp.]
MSDSAASKSSSASFSQVAPASTGGGRYVYCILEGQTAVQLGNIGINSSAVRTVSDSGVTAVISEIPYKQMDSTIDHVMAHQRVVEEARKLDAVVLPVRFGVIINGEAGVRKLLQTSAERYKQKMRQLYQKDEFGIKVILNKEDAAKFRSSVEVESPAVQKLKDEISSSANKGRAYFLSMKLQDAIKTETLRKLEDVSNTIHRELASVAEETAKLKSDVSQVILNASYLVNRNEIPSFEQKAAELSHRFAGRGLTIHKSGPWAPYSFC